MEALKIYTKANKGQLEIAIPKEMEDRNLQIVVTICDELNDNPTEQLEEHLLRGKKRAEAMGKLAGTAPDPNYNFNEDEWYRQ